MKGVFSPIQKHYSKELKGLIEELVIVDKIKRPTINNILSRYLILFVEMEILRQRIPLFLSDIQRKSEFAHTILHNQNVFIPMVKKVSIEIDSAKTAMPIQSQSTKHSDCDKKCLIDKPPVKNPQSKVNNIQLQIPIRGSSRNGKKGSITSRKDSSKERGKINLRKHSRSNSREIPKGKVPRRNSKKNSLKVVPRNLSKDKKNINQDKPKPIPSHKTKLPVQSSKSNEINKISDLKLINKKPIEEQKKLLGNMEENKENIVEAQKMKDKIEKLSKYLINKDGIDSKSNTQHNKDMKRMMELLQKELLGDDNPIESIVNEPDKEEHKIDRKDSKIEIDSDFKSIVVIYVNI